MCFPIHAGYGEKGSVTGVEVIGFDNESDREALDGIIQEVWEDESWR
ncbi:DinI-like family protein [Raoultella ornithinolytica]|nr:DinI-like family protein [Raoultella ornithinolytica]